MTVRSTEFAFALSRAGLKQKDMARLTGRDRSTVGRWMHGELEVPEYAWTIIRLHKRVRDLAAAIPTRSTPNELQHPVSR